MKYNRNDLVDKEYYKTFDKLLGLDYIIDSVSLFCLNRTKLTPNQITTIGFVFGLIAALFFLNSWFIFGAIFYEIRWILDNVDGRVARALGLSSNQGAFWDNISGFIVESVCLFAICMTFGSLIGIILAFSILFLRSLHNYMSMKVISLINVTKVKGNIIGAIYNFLHRHKIREPFNPEDQRILLFIIMPIIAVFGGYLFTMYVLFTILLFLCETLWFYVYWRCLE